jgi:hypothetical protein
VDLYGRRLSFAWNYATAEGGVSELRLDTLSGSHRVLDRTSRDGSTFLSTQGADGRVLYAAADIAAGSTGERVDRLFRRRLKTGDVTLAAAPEGATGVAVTDGALFAASRDEDGGTAVIDVSGAGFFPRTIEADGR